MATERALPRGIRKTASGKYQIRYTGPDGRRYSGGTFRRKIEAEKALSRVEASIEAGTWQALASAADGGLDLWQRVANSAPWLWKGVDNQLFQILCEQVDERQALRDSLTEGLGDWRDRSALRALEKQIVENLSLLGFTPTDRARLGLVEATKSEKMSRLEEMMRRADELRGSG